MTLRTIILLAIASIAGEVSPLKTTYRARLQARSLTVTRMGTVRPCAIGYVRVGLDYACFHPHGVKFFVLYFAYRVIRLADLV